MLFCRILRGARGLPRGLTRLGVVPVRVALGRVVLIPPRDGRICLLLRKHAFGLVAQRVGTDVLGIWLFKRCGFDSRFGERVSKCLGLLGGQRLSERRRGLSEVNFSQ